MAWFADKVNGVICIVGRDHSEEGEEEEEEEVSKAKGTDTKCVPPLKSEGDEGSALFIFISKG